MRHAVLVEHNHRSCNTQSQCHAKKCRVAEGAGVDIVVLACTELPLVVDAMIAMCASKGCSPPSLVLVDPAEALATAMLGKAQLR